MPTMSTQTKDAASSSVPSSKPPKKPSKASSTTSSKSEKPVPLSFSASSSPSASNYYKTSSSSSESSRCCCSCRTTIVCILVTALIVAGGYMMTMSQDLTPQQKHFGKIVTARKFMKVKGLITDDGSCRSVETSGAGLLRNLSAATGDDTSVNTNIAESEKEVICSPCLSYPNNYKLNIDEYDLSKTPNQLQFFSDKHYPFDNTTGLVVENFKKYLLKDEARKQEYIKYSRDFPMPCDMQNTKLDSRFIHPMTKFSRMSMFDLLRLYRNASMNVIFDLEKEPVVCLLALLHTENCRAEEESFQGCILRLGVDNTENLFPDICRLRGFWNGYKNKYLYSAEKKMISTLKKQWYVEHKKKLKQQKKDEEKAKKENNKNNQGPTVSAPTSSNTEDESSEALPNDPHSNALTEKEVERKVKEFWDGRKDYWKKLKRGVIPRSTCRETLDEKQEFTPVEKRKIFPTNYGEPWICPRTNITLHQIGFGIPRSVIVDKVPRTKAFDFMPWMPGKHLGDRNYKVSVHQEAVLKEMYASSYFSFTSVRGGIDSLRHYEILSAGSVPFFPEIDLLPQYSVSHLPRDLLKKVLEMPGVEHMGGAIKDRRKMNFTLLANHYEAIHQGRFINFHTRGRINASLFNPAEYFRIADALLDYTKKYLTCGSLVASILERMGKAHAKKLLIVSRFAYDFMHQQIHVGASELGIPTTLVGEDSVRWTYKMKSCTPLSEMSELKRGEAVQRTVPYLYGNGVTMTIRAINSDLQMVFKPNNSDLDRQIANHEFDAVIYSYVYLGMFEKAPYLDTVKKHYHKNEVAFIDHDDRNYIGPHEYFKLAKHGTMFVREISEQRSCIYKSR